MAYGSQQWYIANGSQQWHTAPAGCCCWSHGCHSYSGCQHSHLPEHFCRLSTLGEASQQGRHNSISLSLISEKCRGISSFSAGSPLCPSKSRHTGTDLHFPSWETSWSPRTRADLCLAEIASHTSWTAPKKGMISVTLSHWSQPLVYRQSLWMQRFYQIYEYL